MSRTQHVWALILAGGEGSRLRALTTKPCGTAVPKQFCSLNGGRSLLEEAVSRAGRLVPRERICTVVTQQHRQWWSESDELNRLPQANLLVQPRNRGTAIGILYSLLNILARDPQATFVLLPSDHHVREESILALSLEGALERIARDPGRPILLGIEPDESDTDLGYIVPGAPDGDGGHRVAQFVEKPPAERAADLIGQGGLWNAFIIASSGQTLLELFFPRFSAIVMEMQVILRRARSLGFPAGGWPALVDLFTRLPSVDFSRDILEDKVEDLSVVHVPPCGWSDLGTPRRVAATLQRRIVTEDTPTLGPTAYLNLAAQHAQFERMMELGAAPR